MARSDITSGLPSYEELLAAQQAASNPAAALQSGLSGLLAGRQIRAQAQQAKQARLEQAEKMLLERSQAARNLATTKQTELREERLTNIEKHVEKMAQANLIPDPKTGRNLTPQAYKVLYPSSKIDTKSIIKIYTDRDRELKDIENAENGISGIEDAFKNMLSKKSSSIERLGKFLPSGVLQSYMAPEAAKYNNTLRELASTAQKALGNNRTAMAEINNIIAGIGKAGTNPTVIRAGINRIKNIVSQEKIEISHRTHQKLSLITAGDTNAEELEAMNIPIGDISKIPDKSTIPALETVLKEE